MNLGFDFFHGLFVRVFRISWALPIAWIRLRRIDAIEGEARCPQRVCERESRSALGQVAPPCGRRTSITSEVLLQGYGQAVLVSYWGVIAASFEALELRVSRFSK